MKRGQGRPFEYGVRPAVGGGYVGVHFATGLRAHAETAAGANRAIREKVNGPAVDARKNPGRMLKAADDQWARWDAEAERKGFKNWQAWARDLMDRETL